MRLTAAGRMLDVQSREDQEMSACRRHRVRVPLLTTSVGVRAGCSKDVSSAVDSEELGSTALVETGCQRINRTGSETVSATWLIAAA